MAPKTDPEPSLDWIREQLPFMRKIAARFARRLPPSLSVEDLVSAGLVALLAVQRRDPGLAPGELERLGASRARYAMLDELRQADPLSRRARKRASDLDRAQAEHLASTGEVATDEALGASIGVSARKVAEARRWPRGRAVPADGEVGELVASTGSPEAETHRGQRIARFQDAVRDLPGRERRVVELYYGEERTLREVGHQLGVTESRASQLLTAAVAQLRVSCASVPPPAR